jgi:TonB family protein
MKRFTLIIIALGFSVFCRSQVLIEKTCQKKSKGECLIPLKEIYKYDDGKYLIKDFNKNGTPEFIMDSARSTDGLDGHVQYFTKKGILIMDGYYDKNVISGNWKIYTEDGKFVREISYNPDYIQLDTNLINVPENIESSYEAMPSFEGGDVNKFRQYVQSHLFYPPDCAEKGVSGKIFVKFSVDKYGNVTDVEIVRGVEKNLDKETIRVVSSSPKWTPGYKKGKPVNVQFTFPVVFILQ